MSCPETYSVTTTRASVQLVHTRMSRCSMSPPTHFGHSDSEFWFLSSCARRVLTPHYRAPAAGTDRRTLGSGYLFTRNVVWILPFFCPSMLVVRCRRVPVFISGKKMWNLLVFRPWDGFHKRLFCYLNCLFGTQAFFLVISTAVCTAGAPRCKSGTRQKKHHHFRGFLSPSPCTA
jgi:hypothetical protein